MTNVAVLEGAAVFGKRADRSGEDADRLKAAFRATGQAALCYMFGGHGLAEIWPNNPVLVALGDPKWRHRFSQSMPPSSDMGSSSGMTVPGNWTILFDLAALVAEAIHGGAASVDAVVEALIGPDFDDLPFEAMDGKAWTIANVRAVARLLLAEWTRVESLAVDLADRYAVVDFVPSFDPLVNSTWPDGSKSDPDMGDWPWLKLLGNYLSETTGKVALPYLNRQAAWKLLNELDPGWEDGL